MEVREYESDGASGNGNSGIVKKEDKNDLNNNDDSEGRQPQIGWGQSPDNGLFYGGAHFVDYLLTVK